MAKKQTVDQLYDNLDAPMDERQYNQLNRSAPLLINVIRGLVRRGQVPEEVAAHILRLNAAVWIEAQHIRAACRHIQREIDAS